jgi:DNA-binding transcriptional regulator YiaG
VTGLRQVRLALGLSQAAFARRLRVSAESYRAWDAGRRTTPHEVLERATTYAGQGSEGPMPLAPLARQLRMNETTLRRAARDGRLTIVVEPHPSSGRCVVRATREAVESFRTNVFGKTHRWTPRPGPNVALPDPPADCARRIAEIRLRLRLTQTEFAARLGAKGKAVVYQWESGKRRPASLFWRRILDLSDPRS